MTLLLTDLLQIVIRKLGRTTGMVSAWLKNVKSESAYYLEEKFSFQAKLGYQASTTCLKELV